MEEKPKPEFQLQCPVELPAGETIVMAHGGGGRLSQRLIEQVFLPAFSAPELAVLHDGACLEWNGRRLAFSTDSYVVRPLVFPGGDIGSLAVNGTVNDLAMCGARPLWLSAAFILEEGLEIALLRRIAQSMARAAAAAGVRLVTGDTKVVDRGKGDQIYITTAGIGILSGPYTAPARVQPGDAILVSGDLGRHGIAILSVREGLQFDAPIESDCAPLWEPVEALFAAGVDVHCLRDLTRGGLSSALNEIAKTRGIAIEIDETSVPVPEVVRGACELLGLDPLYVANEGRFCAFIPAAQLDLALAALARCPVSRGATAIGAVLDSAEPLVTLRSQIGGRRVLDMLSGEQLPRIC